jgi:predicted metalloprotease with PDZ domain
LKKSIKFVTLIEIIFAKTLIHSYFLNDNFMNNNLLFLLTLLFFANCQTSKKAIINSDNGYRYSIDLLNVQNDKVAVTLFPPKNLTGKGKFIIPKLVPGYYGAMDFGQYISDFTAVDKAGKRLKTTQLDKNSWSVEDIQDVFSINYLVADGWDTAYSDTHGAKSPGSMFLKDSAFVINYNSLVGYFEAFKDVPYQITITKPKEFYGSSAIKPLQKNATTDVISTPNYGDLVDAPILYCVPDTAYIHIGETRVLVSLYTKERKSYAHALAARLENLLKNQQAYLGGQLPVKEYAFLIYHETAPKGNFLGDGLEHNNSTLCIFAAHNIEDLPTQLYDVASHEFFHIITPLSIHAKEIQYYDYLSPVLSKHLWLYEGMTEYATIHMPIKQKMVDLDYFISTIERKLYEMARFKKNLSLTYLSKEAMKQQDSYMNFYQKGALVGLCLDIQLRELSNGKMGTQELMQALVKKYGKNTPFDDDALFDVITQMTFPSIRSFFADYVEGTQPLPLKETLLKVGFELSEDKKTVRLLPTLTDKQLALRRDWINE